jgi:transposase
MTHANALLTPRGRLRLARCVVEDGWTYARAAERFQCSTATAKKWADRYRVGGRDAMVDRSSRPHHSPRRLAQRRERWFIKVRFTRRWGPHRIAAYLRMARSTVEAVLRRYQMPLLPRSGPGQRPASPPATAAPLRAPRTRRSRPPRHQKARAHPRRRWAPQAGTPGGATQPDRRGLWVLAPRR